MSAAAQDDMLRQRRGDRVTVQGTPAVKVELENGEPTICRTLFADGLIGLRPKARPRKRKEESKTSGMLFEASPAEDGRAIDDPIPF